MPVAGLVRTMGWVGLVGDTRIEGMMRKLVGHGRRTTTTSVQMFTLLDEWIVVVRVDDIAIYKSSRLIHKWLPFWTIGSLLLPAIILGGITMSVEEVTDGTC
jgi:hypothetical protein